VLHILLDDEVDDDEVDEIIVEIEFYKDLIINEFTKNVIFETELGLHGVKDQLVVL
jgi:hypothetical protein